MQVLHSLTSAGHASLLAERLADIVSLLHDFWRSIDEAPAIVEALAIDCRSLSEALRKVSVSGLWSTKEENITYSVESCACLVAATLAMTADLASHIGGSLIPMSRKHRKWKAIRSTIEEANLIQLQIWTSQARNALLSGIQSRPIYRKIHSRLMDINSSIPLLQNVYLQTSRPVAVLASQGINGQMIALRHEVSRMASDMGNFFFRSCFKRCMEMALKDLFKSISPFYTSSGLDTTQSSEHHQLMSITAVSRPRYGTVLKTSRTTKLNSYSDTKNFFGTVYFRTQWFRVTYHASDPESPDVGSWNESEVSFIFQPAPWVCLKYEHDVIQSSRELCNAIHPYKVVPDNSRVFDFCRIGNLSGLQLLMSRGLASTRDVDADGWTLLHTAAYYGNLDVCMWLIEEGAERDPRTSTDISCVSLVTRRFSRVKLRKKEQEMLINLLRLFLDEVDLGDDEDPFWRALDELVMLKDPRAPQVRRTLRWIAGALQGNSPYGGLIMHSTSYTPALLCIDGDASDLSLGPPERSNSHSAILKYILGGKYKAHDFPDLLEHASFSPFAAHNDFKSQYNFDKKMIGNDAAENLDVSDTDLLLPVQSPFEDQDLLNSIPKPILSERNKLKQVLAGPSSKSVTENSQLRDLSRHHYIWKSLSRAKNLTITALVVLRAIFVSQEIPLGHRRLVWTCLCGFKSYQDYRELEIDALQAFANALVSAGYATAATTNRKGPSRVALCINNFSSIMRNSFRMHPLKNPVDSLPISEPIVADDANNKPRCQSRKKCRWLHLCIKQRPAPTKLEDCHLCHEDSEPSYSDATIFEALRKKYKEKHTVWSRWLYALQDIKFVAFEVYPDDAVDHIQPDQVPPATAPYDFSRTRLLPPIGTDIMMHHFQYPSANQPTSTFLSDKFPKKKEEPLRYSEPSKHDNVGWGLHYVDEMNRALPFAVVLLAGTILSAVFGTCYGVLGKDMQDAWTIATWISSLSGLAVVAWQAAIVK